MAFVVAFFVWITKSPKRILIFFIVITAIAVPMMIKDKAETAKRTEIRQERALQRTHEKENIHHLWIREAIVIKLWENHLGSLPSVAETEIWQEAILGLDRSSGRRIEKLIKHGDIKEFIEGPLAEWIRLEPINNTALDLPMFSLAEAQHLLRIKQDSSGLYSWSGDTYGGYAYRYLSPGSVLKEGDLDNLSAASGDHLDELVRKAYEQYQSLKRSVAVDLYETEEMAKTIQRAEKNILKKAPNLTSAEAKTIVLQAVEESYSYREFQKEFPDYDAREADYFLELL
jgi:hypothetical protein